MLENIFKLKENGTSVKTELLAGLATFLTMAYIIVVNPAILSTEGTGMECICCHNHSCCSWLFNNGPMG